MLHRDYCQKCKRTGIPLHIHRKCNGYYEMWCRDCERERQRRYRLTKAGKLAAARARDNSNNKTPEKYKARQDVRTALDNGKLSKPDKCDICGAETRLYAHHSDYSRPLHVIWVCSGCHANIHGAADAINNLALPAPANQGGKP